MFPAVQNYLGRLGRRETANFGLLLLERAIRLAVGQAIVMVFLARYLGPANFGLFNFALALVALGGALAGLGLDEIIVRELIRRPGTEHPRLLGHAAALKAGGAVAALALAVGAGVCLRPEAPQVWLVIGLLALGLLASPWEVLDWWFQSHSVVAPAVAVRLFAFLVSAGLKLALIFQHAPLPLLAAATALEPGLAALGLLWRARRQGLQLLWRNLAWPEARALLREGAPLLVSGLLVLATMQLDKVLVTQFAGDQAGGYYAAATRITELFYAAPVAFGVVMIPALARQREVNRPQYWREARRLLAGLGLAGVLAALVVSWRADDIVRVLFGGRFSPAAALLKVHIWSLGGIFIVSLRGRLLVLEKGGHWLPVLAGLAAGLSAGLNLWLVPRWGAISAAWVAVAAWTFSALIAPWFFAPLRRLARGFFQRS